jgi:transcriptional regulator with XRE-family HTH domain
MSESTISGWIHKKLVPFANERTQFKPKKICSKKILYNLYIKKGLSASKIAEKMNVSTAVLINWLRKKNIKARSQLESMNTANIKNILSEMKLKKPTKEYKNLTPEKAYILGVLCGDGYIDNKSIRLEIRKDEEFIKLFTKCLERTYGIKYKYAYKKKRNTFLFSISAKILCKDLLKYGSCRTESWKVPKEILNSKNKNIIIGFLRGIYDSEGSIGKYTINLTSVSTEGLADLLIMLRKVGIESKIRKYQYPIIYISQKKNLRLFKDLIGFTIKRKMTKLKNIYKKGWEQ